MQGFQNGPMSHMNGAPRPTYGSESSFGMGNFNQPCSPSASRNTMMSNGSNNGFAPPPMIGGNMSGVGPMSQQSMNNLQQQTSMALQQQRSMALQSQQSMAMGQGQPGMPGQSMSMPQLRESNSMMFDGGMPGQPGMMMQNGQQQQQQQEEASEEDMCANRPYCKGCVGTGIKDGHKKCKKCYARGCEKCDMSGCANAAKLCLICKKTGYQNQIPAADGKPPAKPTGTITRGFCKQCFGCGVKDGDKKCKTCNGAGCPSCMGTGCYAPTKARSGWVCKGCGGCGYTDKMLDSTGGVNPPGMPQNAGARQIRKNAANTVKGAPYNKNTGSAPKRNSQPNAQTGITEEQLQHQQSMAYQAGMMAARQSSMMMESQGGFARQTTLSGAGPEMFGLQSQTSVCPPSMMHGYSNLPHGCSSSSIGSMSTAAPSQGMPTPQMMSPKISERQSSQGTVMLPRDPSPEGKLCSGAGTLEVSVNFVSNFKQPLELYWCTQDGDEVKYATIEPEAKFTQTAFQSSVFRVRDQKTKFSLGAYTVSVEPNQCVRIQ